MNTDKHELGKLSSLYGEIRTVLKNARQSAYRAVNFAMVKAYWRVGCLIVENEQEGKERAEYGKAVLKELSHRLTREFDKGYSVQALRNMRQFYLVFSKRSAVRSESPGAIEPFADQQFEKYSALRSELTWTHYKSLMRVENDKGIEAWQKARELTRGVYAVSGSGQFARDFSLRDQIRRSAVPVMLHSGGLFSRGPTL